MTIKSRNLVILWVLSVLAGIEVWGRFDARLYATTEQFPETGLIFNGFPSGPPNPDELRPTEPFPPGATWRILIGANSTVCLFNGNTFATSSALQVYSARGPVNFTTTQLNNQLVLFTAPGAPSNNPLRPLCLARHIRCSEISA